MARGEALFGAEGGAEGINIVECEREALSVQLAGYGEGYGLSEEILVVIDLAVLHRQIIGIQRGHAEHFARALAVAAGDKGSIYIYKAALMHEAMDRLRSDGADAECALEQVRARTQMLDGAQVFDGVALLLQRIIRSAGAQNFYGFGLQLKGLLCIGRDHQFALCTDGSAHADRVHDLLIAGNALFLCHDLQIAEEGAVIQFNKGKGFAFARGAHPAADFNAAEVLLRHGAVQFPDCHGYPPILCVEFVLCCDIA